MSTREYHEKRTQAKLKKELRKINITTAAGCTSMVAGYLAIMGLLLQLVI